MRLRTCTLPLQFLNRVKNWKLKIDFKKVKYSYFIKSQSRSVLAAAFVAAFVAA